MLPVVCIDVDGTLVGSGGKVLPEVWEATQKAIARGQQLVLCTGRPAVGLAFEYARKLNPNGYHVFQNGASVYQVASHHTLSASFPHHEYHELVALSRRTGWLLEAYTDTEYIVEQPSDVAVQHAKLLGFDFTVQNLSEVSGNIVRVQWIVPLHVAPELLALMPETVTLSPATSPVMPEVNFISLTAKGISKASGIAKIASHFGVTMDRVMMVGDGHNDAEAMQAVGHGVAMANADEVCKAAAKHFVGHVDAGGLIEALKLSAVL